MKNPIMDQARLSDMLEQPLLSYTDDPEKNDNHNSTLANALALYSLVLSEHENPGNEAYAARAAEHFASATAPEHAPCFDAICLWNYCVYSASIALAKVTPSVWQRLSDETVERLTFTMEMYAYLESFATSDENSYSTGPGLTGNYHKGWNPNYRLANVPAILFACHYFGGGDMTAGAARVNAMLRSFDESVYNRVVETLARYGWHRAHTVWTQAARQHEDGSFGTDAKTVLLHGGPTYSYDYTHSYITKDAGNGKGVANRGADYLYHENPLSSPAAIIDDLLAFNYAGGAVKSDHHFDVNQDGEAEKIAWIVDESESPYQGQEGMMLEFASGNRSSTGYCSHDFVLTTCLISAAKALGIHDAKDTPELWAKIKVGNGDFLYKNEKGYLCFATGSYGTSHHEHSEANEGKSYFAMKSLWLTSLKD